MRASPVFGVKPAARRAQARAAVSRTCVASAAAGEVPDMGKRTTMNLLLLGAIGLPGLPLAGGFAYFFVPPSCAPARRALGLASGWHRCPGRRARRCVAPRMPRPDA